MAHLPRDEFSPYFAIWERTANNGLWLSNFLDLLNGLPCKNPKIDHQEIEEFRTLRVKASYFIATTGARARTSTKTATCG